MKYKDQKKQIYVVFTQFFFSVLCQYLELFSWINLIHTNTFPLDSQKVFFGEEILRLKLFSATLNISKHICTNFMSQAFFHRYLLKTPEIEPAAGGILLKKVLLKISQYSKGEHLCWSLFLIKLQAYRTATLLKRYFVTGVFLWILQSF